MDHLKRNHRILCINPAESLEPVVVDQISTVGTAGASFLSNLFVTESGTIYVANSRQREVLACHPSRTNLTEILQCPDRLLPAALLVHDRSLYVSVVAPRANGEPRIGRVYEYLLPPELQLHE